MDIEASAHVDEDKKDSQMQDDTENQNDITNDTKTEENSTAPLTKDAEPMDGDQSMAENSIADASLDVSSRSEGRMGLRRAKTKGELKKQLELKKEKLKNPLVEANDTDSVASPSEVDPKQLDTSRKEFPETAVKWSEGDMFWARVAGHPWWPCLVYRDPIQNLFTKMLRANMRTYHFHFFGTSCERGWVVESSMMQFEGQEKFEVIRQEKMAQLSGMKAARSKSDKILKVNLSSFDIKSNRLSSWKSAADEAEKVFGMTNDERVSYVTDILTSKKKKPRRESTEGLKRKREEQGDEVPKKRSRKSEGSLKVEADELEENLEDTVETNEDSDAEESPAPVKRESETSPVATPTPSQSSKVTNYIRATPERANSTRYTLRAVRKLKKLTDDEKEDDEVAPKSARKSSVASATADDSEDKSEGSINEGVITTKPTGGDAVRTLEIFKLTHNNHSNYKKEEVCVKCESSHPGVMKCKGPCHAPLHPKCAGVEVEDKEADFICGECMEGKHTCFICKTKEGTTAKCSVSTCCFYYHVECLKTLKYVKTDKNQLACPMHVCISCAADAEKTHLANRGRFFKCIRCPNSYHTGDYCLAAGSVVLSTNWIICGDHHTSESKKKHQDHINAAFCFKCGSGGTLVCCESCPASYHMDCCEEMPPAKGTWNCELCTDGKRPMYGEIVWCKAGVYRWWPGEVCHPRNIPTNVQNIPHGIGEFPVYFFGSNDYLWTHRGRVFSFQEGDKHGSKQGHSKNLVGTFNKALEEADEAARIYYDERNKKEQKLLDKKPTPYRHVKNNVPIGSIEICKVPLSEIPRCQCTATMDNPCSPESECLNRIMRYECCADVCLAGDKCGNRLIQLRKDADTEVFRTSDNRGWGLRARSNILKGRFIHEYVGDLIDAQECQKRLRKAKELNVTNFYMFTIHSNRIIDAGPKGNNSRFMNHSCQPNCQSEKWSVNGEVRVGLYALKDISSGEELTFNYNLENCSEAKTVCHCGTSMCSGFLGEKPKSTMADDKTSKSKKQPRKRQRNAPKLPHEDTCFRCGNPGELVLCDKVNCTKSYHLKCLKLAQLPKGKWICPWHLCDEENCGKWAARLCSMCPNSFCSKHAEGNIFTLSTGRLVCDEHPPTCPHLQYLLAQDEAENDRRNARRDQQDDEDDENDATNMNGDLKSNAKVIESPFPLVSTPFQKKVRGRPPKTPKLTESPILGDASKSRTSKTPRRNKSSKLEVPECDLEKDPGFPQSPMEDETQEELEQVGDEKVDHHDHEDDLIDEEEHVDDPDVSKDDKEKDNVPVEASRSSEEKDNEPVEASSEENNHSSEVERTPSEKDATLAKSHLSQDGQESPANVSNGFRDEVPKVRPGIHQSEESK